MSFPLKKYKLLLFAILTILILLSNFSLYRVSFHKPLPEKIIWGSLIDFFIIIPGMIYILYFKNRFSLQKIGFLMLLAYAAAYIIIPQKLLHEDHVVPYFIGVCESSLLIIEIYFLSRLLRKLPAFISSLRTLNKQSSYLIYNYRNTAARFFPGSKMGEISVTDFSLFYYALFSWRKKIKIHTGQVFSFHKKTSGIALYIMLIHATAIETIGLHYFLHQWNPLASYILLFLNIYGFLYFLAEIQTLRLSPFWITEDLLIMQAGLSKGMEVPIHDIQDIFSYTGPEKISSKEYNMLFDARAIDFIQEKPQFEIKLTKPHPIYFMYGFQRKVDRIILSVDDPHAFSQQLKQKIYSFHADSR